MSVIGSVTAQVPRSYYLGSKASPDDLPWGLPMSGQNTGLWPIEKYAGPSR